MMRTILIWIRAIFATFFWGFTSLVGAIFDSSGNFGFRCMSRWARSLLRIGGVEVRTEGFEKISEGRNYLFLSNHQSMVDILALSATIPVKFGWMAKSSLFKIPFLGWHMKKMGYVPIDRKSVTSSTKGLIYASNLLKGGGSLVVFPEGSRSKDGALKSFKDGAFFLALESKTPIIPLCIRGTAGIIRKGSSRINPGEVIIVASDAIEPDKYSRDTRNELKEAVWKTIASNLQ